jgi:hypothetical protein
MVKFLFFFGRVPHFCVSDVGREAGKIRLDLKKANASWSLSSSLGNQTVAGSNSSDISSASFGIQFFYC